jgi:hypothetical protein
MTNRSNRSRFFGTRSAMAGFYSFRHRTFIPPHVDYPQIIKLRETDMTTIGSKIFGTISGSAIFFGVGIALARAAVIS